MTGTAPRSTPDGLGPLVTDLVCVLAFAVAGRNSHEPSSPGLVVLAIVWPFALSVAVAHVGLLMRRRRTRRVWPEGIVILAVTYLLGMTLRVMSGRGTAVGFLVVAGLFLALTLLGWRTVLRLVTSRQTSR